MASIEKINIEIEKNKVKIAELQKKNKALEAQRTELENLEIVKSVKAFNLDTKSLTAFLEAYAKGKIKLPDNAVTEQEDTDNE